MKGILVATSPEGIIGKDNTIPWHYSEDLKNLNDLQLEKYHYGRKNMGIFTNKTIYLIEEI